MIYRFISLALLATLPIASAQSELDIRAHEAPVVCAPGTGQVQVTVTGVTNGGILAVELYRPSKRDFLKKKSRIHRIRVAAQDGQQTVCFAPQPPGRYAVATYHDKNANRDLDQKINFMPKEPFGLSTNPKLRWGLPKFDEADFELPAEGAAITIQLVK
ncbi:MAG: DUF2141 domain-containing protein [Henriciella sp.]|nr:DUF2141 domain-containing protein [Henriciella sp.]